jgi:hypothetical protein
MNPLGSCSNTVQGPALAHAFPGIVVRQIEPMRWRRIRRECGIAGAVRDESGEHAASLLLDPDHGRAPVGREDRVEIVRRDDDDLFAKCCSGAEKPTTSPPDMLERVRPVSGCGPYSTRDRRPVARRRNPTRSTNSVYSSGAAAFVRHAMRVRPKAERSRFDEVESPSPLFLKGRTLDSPAYIPVLLILIVMPIGSVGAFFVLPPLLGRIDRVGKVGIFGL